MLYGFIANSYAFQQCKHFENRLRFHRVTESLKVGIFLRHSVYQCVQILSHRHAAMTDMSVRTCYFMVTIGLFQLSRFFYLPAKLQFITHRLSFSQRELVDADVNCNFIFKVGVADFHMSCLTTAWCCCGQFWTKHAMVSSLSCQLLVFLLHSERLWRLTFRIFIVF